MERPGCDAQALDDSPSEDEPEALPLETELILEEEHEAGHL